MLVAHRGFRSKTGENRMVDFEKALKTCKAVEFDIRLTKDKKIIIFHDHSLRRIGNTNKTVKQMTYQEIISLPFFLENPKWTPALFIDDFINKLADQYEMINVEVKPDRNTRQEYEIFESALALLRMKTKAEIIVSSFGKNTLKWITTLNSNDFKKGYLFEKPNELDFELIKEFDYVHPYIGTVKQKRNIPLFNRINLPMNIWTFKNNKQVTEVKKLYSEKWINAYISDNKDLKTD